MKKHLLLFLIIYPIFASKALSSADPSNGMLHEIDSDFQSNNLPIAIASLVESDNSHEDKKLDLDNLKYWELYDVFSQRFSHWLCEKSINSSVDAGRLIISLYSVFKASHFLIDEIARSAAKKAILSGVLYDYKKHADLMRHDPITRMIGHYVLSNNAYSKYKINFDGIYNLDIDFWSVCHIGYFRGVGSKYDRSSIMAVRRKIINSFMYDSIWHATFESVFQTYTKNHPWKDLGHIALKRSRWLMAKHMYLNFHYLLDEAYNARNKKVWKPSEIELNRTLDELEELIPKSFTILEILRNSR
ncbi:MAG: hypothetical protein AB8G05_08050 [Oligoflexales bacterium]